MKKKIITVVIIMLIGIIQFMPFSSVSAATRLTYTSNNVVGEIQWTNEVVQDAVNGQPTQTTATLNGDLIKTTININWGVVCSGTFTIVFNAYNSGNAFLCQDCKMTNYGTLDNGRGSATFSFYGQDFVQIVYYHAQANWYPTTFSGTWNKNSNSVIESIEEISSTITSYLYNGTDNYNYLWSIDGLLQDIVLDIDNSIIPKLNSMNNTLSAVSTSLTSLYDIDKIQTFELWQQNILFWATKYGTLKFDQFLPYFYYDSSNNSGNYTNANRIRIDANSTICMYVYSTVAPANANVNVYHASSFTGTPVQAYSYNGNANPLYPLYLRRIDFENTNNTTVYIDVEFNFDAYVYPLFLGNKNQVPDEIHQLFGDDYNNTYTRLLEQIKQGINDISFVNNTTQTTINSNVNNYNDYTTEIHNIENNYITQFNNYKNDITTPSLPTAITNGITNYKTFIDGFFNGVPYIKTILSVILFCFLIVCLLGV